MKTDDCSRTTELSMEELISNMDIPNKDKERLYLDVLKQKSTNGTVLWRDGRIVGFKPNKPIEKISLTIKVGEQGIEVDNGKEAD